ncbi:MAG: HD domain-containing protein [Candidatus Thorarchaeota archaeon]
MISDKELLQIITETSDKESRDEWIAIQRNSDLPLYNYRLDHIKRVVNLSKLIGRDVGANMEIVELAAWLHDIAKPGMGGVKNHGVESAKIAKAILLEHGYPRNTIDSVCDVIRKHVGLTLDIPLLPIEAQVVWEADKLDKLGMIGFIHYIINGIKIHPGRSMNEMAESLKEYLPLAEKIERSMSSATAKRIAKKRLKHLNEISSRLDEEFTDNEMV